MVRAAQDRPERGAGKKERADDEQERAEDGRAGGADRDADGAAEHLPEIAALVAPEREHQPERGDDDAARNGRTSTSALRATIRPPSATKTTGTTQEAPPITASSPSASARPT